MKQDNEFKRVTFSIPDGELQAADDVFSKLGLSRSAAIRMFMHQVALKQAIPFDLTNSTNQKAGDLHD